MASTGPDGWQAGRSGAPLLFVGGTVLALLGYGLVRLAGTDPESLLAYVGGAMLVVGQAAAVVGLVGLAWLVLRG